VLLFVYAVFVIAFIAAFLLIHMRIANIGVKRAGDYLTGFTCAVIVAGMLLALIFRPSPIDPEAWGAGLLILWALFHFMAKRKP
jgi:hypothetical protein